MSLLKYPVATLHVYNYASQFATLVYTKHFILQQIGRVCVFVCFPMIYDFHVVVTLYDALSRYLCDAFIELHHFNVIRRHR